MTPDPPRPAAQPGELVYGCTHETACGTVASVSSEAVATDDCGRCHFVSESWLGRRLRVRREANGLLYEVTKGAI